jgi:hypothetical protein
MNSDISVNTRETIWKYLKLITISLASNSKKDNTFLDTSKLFESLNHDDFKEKLQDTMEKMQNVFETSVSSNTKTENKTSSENSDAHFENNPFLNKSMSSMLDGKLGDLAKEIAEETAGNMNLDMDNMTNAQDVFKGLFQNPAKLMGLVKSVGDKLESKIKNGDIKESELFSEATEIMKNMKNIPGMDNIQDMLKNMGMNSNDLARNMNIPTNKLSKQSQISRMKERLNKQNELKHTQKVMEQLLAQQKPPIQPLTQTPPTDNKLPLSDQELCDLFDIAAKKSSSSSEKKSKKNKN